MLGSRLGLSVVLGPFLTNNVSYSRSHLSSYLSLEHVSYYVNSSLHIFPNIRSPVVRHMVTSNPAELRHCDDNKCAQKCSTVFGAYPVL